MKKFLGKKKTPEENPYAQQQAEQDAYNSMTPYQRARADVNSAGGRPGGLPSGPGPQRNSPAPSAGSGNPYASNQGYGSDRYGSGGGYGSDRYGSNTGAYSSNAPPPASGRSGGYGGFGPRDDDPSANDSNDLFGGAKSRVPPGQNPYENNPYAKSTRPDPNLANNPYANPSANRGGNAPDYGGSDYANENLTPEELEEKEISQIKQQQKQARVDALSSANRTLQMMDQIEVTGRGTLARLGQQSERLHNAKDNLTIAESHTKVAQDKAKELKTLNRSMFAVHVSNPFTSGKRERAADEAILNRNRGERQARESNRADAYASNQRMERHFEALDKYQSQPPPERPARSQADKSKYDFENDSEDEAMEEQIDAAMYKMEQGAPKLKELALRMGQEIDEQNKFIDTIQTDHIHDGIVRTQATLNRIK